MMIPNPNNIPDNSDHDNKSNDIKNEIDSFLTLSELGPQELENIFKVISNISFYDDVYTKITTYIIAMYQNIDLNLVEKSGDIIEKQLSSVSFGERLLIYNKLLEPFISHIFTEYKFLIPKQRTFRDPLKDINDMILSIHPYINMNRINNLINEVENQTNNMNMKYEDKFLLYNGLAHSYLKDLIQYAQ